MVTAKSKVLQDTDHLVSHIHVYVNNVVSMADVNIHSRFGSLLASAHAKTDKFGTCKFHVNVSSIEFIR